MIKTKRIQKKENQDDGYRIFVERTWPRGLSEERQKVDLWLSELAPSDALRNWFSHDPKKWETFRARYQLELQEKEELVEKVKQLEEENGTITLLYSSKNEKFNDAVVLKDIFAEEYQL
jgi:uncharacterized protein YeaO (DUF488 family)